ncbi:multicopper oxidase domain-containing protein [Alicyclobacillus acidiphilus]|uniref:multicopper oxidase domain-containing protein n=1 Tax=Alicyclobacillus acidiphilus TaxID=182455 RepID=UPI00082BA180|nr:multicopper oxidase domain-containing protein [Alicyclobacillus acidiphilus]
MVNHHLDQPTTLHWHGVNVPSPMDGVPGISQDPIMPGQSFTFEFVAGPSGTRWYHSHVFEMDQIPNGLFGALIIEPVNGTEPYPADRDMTLILSTWGYQSNPGFDYGMQASGGMGSNDDGGRDHDLLQPGIDPFDERGHPGGLGLRRRTRR